MEAANTALELSLERAKAPFGAWMAGFGADDDELRWLMARGYQVMAKGLSNRRAEALAAKVKQWDGYQENS